MSIIENKENSAKKIEYLPPRSPFTHLIIIESLGLLYGSSGRFLSPENLVGRSGSSFPPHAATLSGLFASAKKPDTDIRDLMLAGPFWGNVDEVTSEEQNFYVPTPRNYLIKDGKVVNQLRWYREQKAWLDQEGKTVNDKYESNTWLAINHWNQPQAVEKIPWKFLPHLHPRLELGERHVIRQNPQEDEQTKIGSLFLENSVQMKPDTCLVYLSNTELDSGWYRFGGEGHIVDVQCQPINSTVNDLLKESINQSFALITPGVWGSNRLSKREPIRLQKHGEPESQEDNIWQVEALLTDRPVPLRYRLGGQKGELSRGRYAVPVGTVYVVETSIDQPWVDWSDQWFPQEGPSLKRWGCGLALPLPQAIAQS